MGRELTLGMLCCLAMILAWPGLLMCLWSAARLTKRRGDRLMDQPAKRSSGIAGWIAAAAVLALILYTVRIFYLPADFTPWGVLNRDDGLWGKLLRFAIVVSIPGAVVAPFLRYSLEPVRARSSYPITWMFSLLAAGVWTCVSIFIFAVIAWPSSPGTSYGMLGVMALGIWVLAGAAAPAVFFAVLSAYPLSSAKSS
jgi:hypothetical protein